MDDWGKPKNHEGQTRSGQYRENVVNFSRRKGRPTMTAAAASSFWPQGGGVPDWWPQDAQEAKEVRDLIEQQVRASAQLTGQVGRLDGQMEAVRQRLADQDHASQQHRAHQDQVNQRLETAMDAVAASVARIEEQRKSAQSFAKAGWAVLLAFGGMVGWILHQFGIGKQ